MAGLRVPAALKVLAKWRLLQVPCGAMGVDFPHPIRRGADVAKGSGRYADVNGIKLYYETHGSGRPLVLLHGGLGATSMFGPNLPALAKGRQVIG